MGGTLGSQLVPQDGGCLPVTAQVFSYTKFSKTQHFEFSVS
jgi:hypothetical protein